MKYIIYTDGACSNNQNEKLRVGAYAFVIFKKENGVVFKSDDTAVAVAGATNNQMEIRAVIDGLKKVIAIDSRPDVTIRSDSQYVIAGWDSLDQWKADGWKTKSRSPVKNKELWFELESLIAKCASFGFEKVKGDGNDKWNDYVDILARKACGSKPKRRNAS